MDSTGQIQGDLAPLYGVVTTLRRLYAPRFEMEAAFTAALTAIDRNEHIARSQIAAMAQSRQPTSLTA